jgi:hypothetical protein
MHRSMTHESERHRKIEASTWKFPKAQPVSWANNGDVGFGSEAVVDLPKTASALPSKADISSDVDTDLAEHQANVG